MLIVVKGKYYFLKTLEQGFPTSRPWTDNSCQISGWIRLEIKCTGNVMPLNHPEPYPHTSVHGKIVFHETRPCCQKRWGPLLWKTSLCVVCACSVRSNFLRPFPRRELLEWVAISFSRGSSWPKGPSHASCISCTDRQIPYHLCSGTPRGPLYM